MGSLLVIALILAALMTWRTLSAERRHRLAAERIMSELAAIVGEEIARRTIFEYEQFGFSLLRPLLARGLRDGRVPSAQDLRQHAALSVRQASALVDEVFVADFAARSVAPPLRSDLQQWILENLETVMAEREQFAVVRQIVRVSLRDGDHWIAYVRPIPGTRRMAGIVVRSAALTEYAQRALERRAPFPVTFGDRLSQRDVYLRIWRPSREILRTPGAFDPPMGRRFRFPDELGDVLGGATVECSISRRVVPAVIPGGIPRGGEAGPLAMLVGTICVLGAMLLVLRRARLLDRLRADFVAGVSHELRTPITQIRMFAETLMLSRLPSEAQRQRSLENIAREATRLSNLVENLLSFTRGERGTLHVVRTNHDVCAIVREAVASFTTLASHRNVCFHVEAPEECIASVDEDALRQIVLNLLDNAVKYGSSGQTIDVIVIPQDDAISVIVEDEGPGIPADERHRIWMKYYRLEQHRETHVAGSGIGLAVVRELVERHDGFCLAEAGSRGGTRFVVEIPWRRDE
ncbi:MAG TPA: HAMP domain-containing sensor histidine kinase [Thermoanaerobaculia bacterium]|nr:HAMP domain-containing sensor histidine kinase [Thermoanaerobaculia bacterium]